MTCEARGFLAVEDELAPPHVAAGDLGRQLLQAGLLFGEVGVKPRVKPLCSALDRCAKFRQVFLERVNSEAGKGRRFAEVLDESQPQSFIAGLLEGRQQAIGLEWPGDLGGIRESFQLRRRQPRAPVHRLPRSGPLPAARGRADQARK